MIVFCHQIKTLIDFWCRPELNPKSFIQLLETLPVELTRTYRNINWWYKRKVNPLVLKIIILLIKKRSFYSLSKKYHFLIIKLIWSPIYRYYYKGFDSLDQSSFPMGTRKIIELRVKSREEEKKKSLGGSIRWILFFFFW